jgi:hypothetical protein
MVGAHSAVCQAIAVDSTNANKSAILNDGATYQIYGYTSATDFTAIGISCLAGPTSVNVTAATGVKILAGNKEPWTMHSPNLYISCKTGSGSGYYDICKQE